MFLNTQSNSKWANDPMGIHSDPMKLWGCLVTCLANIYDITPAELNYKLRLHKGYERLNNPNSPKGSESNIVWSVASDIMSFKRIDYAKFENDISDKVFYIARILHRKFKTGHYCNVLSKKGNQYEIFDTDFGDTKLYNEKDITKFIKIIKD